MSAQRPFVKIGKLYLGIHQINTITDLGTAMDVNFQNGAYRDIRGQEADDLRNWLKSHSTDSADYKPTQEPIPELEPETATADDHWHGYDESRER